MRRPGRDEASEGDADEVVPCLRRRRTVFESACPPSSSAMGSAAHPPRDAYELRDRRRPGGDGPPAACSSLAAPGRAAGWHQAAKRGPTGNPSPARNACRPRGQTSLTPEKRVAARVVPWPGAPMSTLGGQLKRRRARSWPALSRPQCLKTAPAYPMQWWLRKPRKAAPTTTSVTSASTRGPVVLRPQLPA
jgi:hypothetical protein